MTILAGDIGGTKANLALYEMEAAGGLALIEGQRYTSHDYESLELLIEAFIAGRQREIRAACFGVPGAVIDGEARLPNLPWLVSREKLAAALSLKEVQLINDLEATAHGIHALDANQLVTLNEGEAQSGGNLALIAAGTGLGEAALFHDGAQYRVAASEGGHADFAPRNQLEMELLAYLLTKHRRVSYERVLSGPGLVNVYNFFKQREDAAEPAWLSEALASGEDEAQTIAEAALSGKAELCVKALSLFVKIYGAQAGNLALIFKATGGLYVGGGIAPKIIEKLKDGTFMRNYGDKGRMSGLVNSIPVRVILDDKTALYGAARYALLQSD